MMLGSLEAVSRAAATRKRRLRSEDGPTAALLGVERQGVGTGSRLAAAACRFNASPYLLPGEHLAAKAARRRPDEGGEGDGRAPATAESSLAPWDRGCDDRGGRGMYGLLTPTGSRIGSRQPSYGCCQRAVMDHRIAHSPQQSSGSRWSQAQEGAPLQHHIL